MGSGGNNLEDIIPKNMNFSQLDMVRILSQISKPNFYILHTFE